MLLQLGEHVHLPQELLVTALAGLLSLVNAALNHFDVRHDQLHIDDLNVAEGVGGAFHMGDIGIFKASDHVDDGIGGADVAEELVPKTFALGGALYQTCNIDELDDCGGVLLGLVEIGQPVESFVRHGNHTHIGVDGTEGIVVRRNTCVGDGIKEGGLAYVGKSYDT